VQHEKWDRISNAKLNDKSVHEVVKYTKVHIRYNVLISMKLKYLAIL
jgi:hypothetical protein